MDSSYGRSRRPRNQVTCRRRGASPSTDTTDSDADTDEDPEHGVRISSGWPSIANRSRFRQRLNQRNPLNRTRYRTRERSRSPVTPSPPASRLISPVVSLSRMPHFDALLSTGRVSWAPADWSGSHLVSETSSIVTQSSTSTLGDSDSFSTPSTIRIVRRTIPSTEEDDDDDGDEHQHGDDDEENRSEDVYSQVAENLENTVTLNLIDSSGDEDEDDRDDDDDLELAEIYGINLDHDYSETEGADDRNWPAVTPSEDEVETIHHPQPSTSTQRPIPPVTQEDGSLAGTLMELLECPVCYEPMQPPIWQCSRGHLVCRDCAPKLRRCPTCRCAAQRTRNCTLEKVSSALRYPCRNRHRGCPVNLPPAHLTPHEERECAFRDATCRVQSCSWRGEPNAAAAHARTTHAGLTRMLQLGRPVIMGVSVPPSSGQRVTRILRLVGSDRVFYVHLQLNNSPTVAQWCSYVQEFGHDTVNAPLEYRLDLDEEGAEKRLVRPDVVSEVVALIIEGSGRKVDDGPDDDRVTGPWRDRTYRARVYTPTEIPDEAPGSSRTRCYSYGQIKKGFYISNSGSVKVRIIVTLWASPAIRTEHDAGDHAMSRATVTATSTATSAQS